jgi:hypothetical protein
VVQGEWEQIRRSGEVINDEETLRGEVLAAIAVLERAQSRVLRQSGGNSGGTTLAVDLKASHRGVEYLPSLLGASPCNRRCPPHGSYVGH